MNASDRLDELLRTTIRARLDAQGRKQRWLAAELGVTEKHMSQMLTGKSGINVTLGDRALRLLGCRLVIYVRPEPEEHDVRP